VVQQTHQNYLIFVNSYRIKLVLPESKSLQTDIKYRKMFSPMIKKIPRKIFYFVEYGKKENENYEYLNKV
jgi:hypothetical protein